MHMMTAVGIGGHAWVLRCHEQEVKVGVWVLSKI